MKNNYFDLLIVPEVASKLRKIRLSQKRIRVFLTLSTLFMTIIGISLVDYVTLLGKKYQIEKTHQEAQIYNEKIYVLEQKIAVLEQNLDRLRVFKEKLRLITDVGEKMTHQSLAIGPLSEQEELSRQQNRVFYDPGVSTVSMNLTPEDLFIKTTELKEQMELEEVDFATLFEVLRDQQSRLVSTPSIFPARGLIHSGFGMRRSPFTGKLERHDGLDIAAEYGTNVVSTADGVVVFSGTQNGYGKVVVIAHGYGVSTKYGHNSQLLVSSGDPVKRGQVIARVGNTGRATGTHLHYEVLRNGIAVNPKNYIVFDSSYQ